MNVARGPAHRSRHLKLRGQLRRQESESLRTSEWGGNSVLVALWLPRLSVFFELRVVVVDCEAQDLSSKSLFLARLRCKDTV